MFKSFSLSFHVFKLGSISFPKIFYNMSALLKPPESVYGMTTLDKSKFQKEVNVCCLNLKNVNLSKLIPHLKKYLLKMECFKPVQNINNDSFCIYLHPEKVSKWEDIEDTDRQKLAELGVMKENIENKKLIIAFENYSADAILKAVLPANQEGMSSYTKVGHIVHINLREHLHLYKHVIGKVLHEKVVNCRTVVNKIDMIDNTYRNFQMEILSGDDDMNVTVKENCCTYQFDFSKVYWNSRLCTEHERLIKIFQTGDVVFDIFAGVGPFAIPAAKKKCIVYANDLNPESFKWLNHNKKLNKIEERYLKSYCKDGKDFILTDIKEILLQHLNVRDVHIVMNLPALAVQFLDNLVGLYDSSDVPEFTKRITVYVYCFTKGEDYTNLAKTLVINNFSVDISKNITEIFRVRTVSSLKEMMRVSINLTREILTASKSCNIKRKSIDDEKIQNKRRQ